MVKELIIENSKDMISLGERIGKCAFPNMLICMNGDLGAGKTTLTKGIGLALNIQRIINSPTFTIMKIYEGNLNLYHLDVYRVNSSKDDFELEEYFDNGGVCVIEWARIIEDILPKDRLDLDIFDLGDDKRKVILKSDAKEYFKVIENC